MLEGIKFGRSNSFPCARRMDNQVSSLEVLQTEGYVLNLGSHMGHGQNTPIVSPLITLIVVFYMIPSTPPSSGA